MIIERESNGTFSAWVAGLPGVYAAADTPAAAKRGIRSALAAHLDALNALGQNVKPPKPTYSCCGMTSGLAPAANVDRAR